MLKIDKTLKKHLIPLTDEELAWLEKSLAEEGCRDPIVVWRRKAGVGYESVIVDGHNRYAICQREGIEFETHTMMFADRSEAEDWIDRNQLGRRNLSPADFKIVSGRIYNRRKKNAGERGPSKKLDQIEPAFESTADVVAEELGSSGPTIKRNGQRAEVYDAMVDHGDEDAAEVAKTAPQAVIAEVKDKPPAEQAKALKEKPTPKPKAKDDPKPEPSRKDQIKNAAKLVKSHHGQVVRLLDDLARLTNTNPAFRESAINKCHDFLAAAETMRDSYNG